jgi:hypothetical protein
MEPEEINVILNFLQLAVLLIILFMVMNLNDMAHEGLKEFLRR